MTPDFLTVEDVLIIHAGQIQRFGGALGLRDPGLLQAACAQPPSTFDGQWLHAGLYEMAGAYLYHLVQNHPFVDGNKRVGLAAALTFLALNGRPVRHGTEALFRLTMGVASGGVSKQEIAPILRALAEGEPPSSR